MVLSRVGLRPCVVEDGFHALHWKMLRYLEFGCCMRVLRVFRRRCVVRDVSGCCKAGLLRVEDVWFIDGVVVWGGSAVLTGFMAR